MQISEVQKTLTVAQLLGISDGAAGTKETLKIMRRLVRDGKKSVIVRNAALSLLHDVLQKDYLTEIKRAHNFVQNEIRYVRDINGVETLQTPEKTLEIKQGDCDDKSTLVAAMLESIGHPTRFVAAGHGGGEFEHVWVETKYGQQWIAVECTEPVPLGWKAPGMSEFLIINN